MEKLTIPNDQVESTIKARGEPKKQKIHGKRSTVLFYEEKEEKPSEKNTTPTK